MLPSTMKAARYSEYGAPEVIKIIDAPLPDVGERDVLMRVRATSLTRRDVAQRAGKINMPNLPLPFQLGREAAGEVAALGDKVSEFAVGDRIVTMSCPACGKCDACRRGFENHCAGDALPGRYTFGGYAEYLTLTADHVAPAPENLSFEQLACLVWAYSTSLNMTIRHGKLEAGQDVLVTGATGAMGLAGIQVARSGGAKRVFGLAGSPAKAERLRQLGVDAVVNYAEENVPESVRALTGGRGVDLVLDNVGGPMFTAGFDSLSLGGTLVAIAVHGGREVPFSIRDLFYNDRHVTGTRGATRRDQYLALELAAAGRIDPVIDKIFTLDDIVAAHHYFERSEHVGRIPITV